MCNGRCALAYVHHSASSCKTQISSCPTSRCRYPTDTRSMAPSETCIVNLHSQLLIGVKLPRARGPREVSTLFSIVSSSCNLECVALPASDSHLAESASRSLWMVSKMCLCSTSINAPTVMRSMAQLESCIINLHSQLLHCCLCELPRARGPREVATLFLIVGPSCNLECVALPASDSHLAESASRSFWMVSKMRLCSTS